MRGVVSTLVDLCLLYVVEHIDSVDDFGDLDDSIKQKMMAKLFTVKNCNLSSVVKLIDSSTKRLDLSGWRVNKETPFEELLGKAGLCSLKISGSVELDDVVVERILKSCGASLVELEVVRCPRVTDYIMQLIFKLTPKLEKLSLEDCIGVSGRYIGGLHKVKKGDKQKHVVVSQCMEHLVDLNLSGCRSIIASNFVPFSSFFPRVSTLCLSKLFLNDEDAVSILQTLPLTMRHLDISVNPISCKTMAELCQSPLSPLLESVCLRACRCISAQDVQFSFSELFTALPNLKNLDISQCFQISENDFVGLTAVEPPTSVARNLATLNLSNCHKLTNFSVEHLSKLGVRYSLKNLFMSGCEHISDDILTYLIEWFPLLERVDLAGCGTVLSSDDVNMISLKAPKLMFRTSAFSTKYK